MTCTYILLPDGREPSGSVFSAFKELGEGSLELKGDESHYVIRSSREPHDVLTQLAGIDWHRPLLVTYRGAGEDRWSYCTITGSARVPTE